ncbi:MULTISPECIES: family 10 glycosylhydrolase [Spirulina sp. CCY15215]|uniref:family 10 glycosylhydrolase n=1 Tax=Spirulina sp. CCY15215 TaxID=2767591 RepID=UPI001950FC26|nr:family 10 glycosylhydrolase [Spirulina major]
MSESKKKQSGCGCSSIPFSAIILFMGLGYLLFSQRDRLDIGRFIPSQLQAKIPFLNASTPEEVISSPTLSPSPVSTEKAPTLSLPSPSPVASQPSQKPDLEPAKPSVSPSPSQKPWKQKNIRGIYLSRYQVTNNANEETIRKRVRYYRDRGINTIIHGVWGNTCTMYKSEVLEKKFGYRSCPNQFQDPWLDWLIDEAHKQGMEVHAYFEKGIKIDKNSPLFDLAIERRWIVAGVDKTHKGVDHYVLDISIPEVSDFLTEILVEFVQKYPTIDAVQWDDYLGYHAELPGQVDRTAKLTDFVQKAIAAMKKANPAVNFDICHHNPYWAKKYFAADWKKWNVDRVFIQVYDTENFNDELKYVKAQDGISITERQFDRLEELVKDPQIKSILLFPLSGKPEEMAATFDNLMKKTN